MPTDFFKLFTELGLSNTETRVYLASLKLGPTSVQEIAKKAKLSRTATYDVIAALQERGLLSTFERGKKKFFAAEDPDRAVSYFKRRVHDMEDQISLLDRNMDEMKLLAGGERPTVRFYEGQEALHALFNDVDVVQPKALLEVANIDNAYDKLDEKLLMEARRILDPSKMDMRVLHQGELRNPMAGAQYCRLLPEFGDVDGEIWVYGNRVAFVKFVGKVITVVIESETFSNSARVLFNAAWTVCKVKPFKGE